MTALNLNWIPDYLKQAKLVMISKTSSSEAKIEDYRPIMVTSHLAKVLEKCIKNKITQLKSSMLQTGDYQSAFKPGESTH